MVLLNQLTLKEKNILSLSILTINRNNEFFVIRFYHHLLQSKAKILFKQTDIENQHVLFSNSLDIIFSHIDNPKVLEEYLSKLIEKHKKLGLTGEYTAYFADSFIAIKEIFPNDSDELIAEIWNKAISEIMSYFKIRLENKI